MKDRLAALLKVRSCVNCFALNLLGLLDKSDINNVMPYSGVPQYFFKKGFPLFALQRLERREKDLGSCLRCCHILHLPKTTNMVTCIDVFNDIFS